MKMAKRNYRLYCRLAAALSVFLAVVFGFSLFQVRVGSILVSNNFMLLLVCAIAAASFVLVSFVVGGAPAESKDSSMSSVENGSSEVSCSSEPVPLLAGSRLVSDSYDFTLGADCLGYLVLPQGFMLTKVSETSEGPKKEKEEKFFQDVE